MENFFGKEIIPTNETERLQALYRYKLLNNIPERYFTNLAQIIARTFDTPIALVSLVDKEEVSFPGNYGMENTTTVPRGLSLCSLAILNQQPTIFENALDEPCLLANPLVAGEFGLRFYAGAPVVTAEGFHIGTVCIVDKEPRSLTTTELEMLKDFAGMVIEELDMRVKLIEEATEQ
jgi:GAF domain-containing protein